MSIFPTLTQLGLILCILGLVAAFPNEKGFIDIFPKGALDTATKEPLNTSKDNVEDLMVLDTPSGESDSLEDTNPAEKGKCKPGGVVCIRGQECCSRHCNFYGRRCFYDSPIGPYLL